MINQKAAQFGVDIFTIGTAIKLVTEGIMIGKYRPNDIDEELEIYVRYPESDRSIDQLDNVMIESSVGKVPISNFLTRSQSKMLVLLEDGTQEMLCTLKQT